MTLEEKLIAEYLKNNKPKQVESSDTCKDIYSRGYIKLVSGKKCSYCGTILNEDNTFVKVVNTLRLTNDTVSCKKCSLLDVPKKGVVKYSLDYNQLTLLKDDQGGYDDN